MIVASSSGTSTGSWTLGIVVPVLFIAIAIWLAAWWILRLITRPFRAMRRPAPLPLHGGSEAGKLARPNAALRASN